LHQRPPAVDSAAELSDFSAPAELSRNTSRSLTEGYSETSAACKSFFPLHF
jgi:hypothetical protein